MGLSEKVIIALVITALTQIACRNCMPRISTKASLKRYLDNLKAVKGNPSPTSFTPSRINQLPKQILKKKIQNGRVNTNSVPQKSLYDTYNFPHNDYPLDNSQRDPFRFGSLNGNNKVSTLRRASSNPQCSAINDLKREMKRKRKLLSNSQYNDVNRLSENETPMMKVRGSDATYSLDQGAFPEVQYPLTTMETWEPKYWNCLPFTQDGKQFNSFRRATFKPKVQNKPFTRLTKTKANKFLQSYDVLKGEQKGTSTENSKRSSTGQQGLNFTKTATCEKVTDEFISAGLVSVSPNNESVSKTSLKRENITNMEEKCEINEHSSDSQLNTNKKVDNLENTSLPLQLKNNADESNELINIINEILKLESIEDETVTTVSACNSSAETESVDKLNSAIDRSINEDTSSSPIENTLNKTAPFNDTASGELIMELSNEEIADEMQNIRIPLPIEPQHVDTTCVEDTSNISLPLSCAANVTTMESLTNDISSTNSTEVLSNGNAVQGSTSIIIIPINNNVVGKSQSHLITGTTDKPIIVFIPTSQSSDSTQDLPNEQYDSVALEKFMQDNHLGLDFANMAPLQNRSSIDLVSEILNSHNRSSVPMDEPLPINSMCYSNESNISSIGVIESASLELDSNENIHKQQEDLYSETISSETLPQSNEFTLLSNGPFNGNLNSELPITAREIDLDQKLMNASSEDLCIEKYNITSETFLKNDDTWDPEVKDLVRPLSKTFIDDANWESDMYVLPAAHADCTETMNNVPSLLETEQYSLPDSKNELISSSSDEPVYILEHFPVGILNSTEESVPPAIPSDSSPLEQPEITNTKLPLTHSSHETTNNAEQPMEHSVSLPSTSNNLQKTTDTTLESALLPEFYKVSLLLDKMMSHLETFTNNSKIVPVSEPDGPLHPLTNTHITTESSPLSVDTTKKAGKAPDSLFNTLEHSLGETVPSNPPPLLDEPNDLMAIISPIKGSEQISLISSDSTIMPVDNIFRSETVVESPLKTLQELNHTPPSNPVSESWSLPSDTLVKPSGSSSQPSYNTLTLISDSNISQSHIKNAEASQLPISESHINSIELASLSKDQQSTIKQINNSEVTLVSDAVIDGSPLHTTILLSGDSLDDLPSEGNKPYSTSTVVLTKALLESLLSGIEKREFSLPVNVAPPVKSPKLIDHTEEAEPSRSALTQARFPHESCSVEDKTQSDLDLSHNLTDYHQLSESQDLLILPLYDTLSKIPNLHISEAVIPQIDETHEDKSDIITAKYSDPNDQLLPTANPNTVPPPLKESQPISPNSIDGQCLLINKTSPTFPRSETSIQSLQQHVDTAVPYTPESDSLTNKCCPLNHTSHSTNSVSKVSDNTHVEEICLLAPSASDYNKSDNGNLARELSPSYSSTLTSIKASPFHSSTGQTSEFSEDTRDELPFTVYTEPAINSLTPENTASESAETVTLLSECPVCDQSNASAILSAKLALDHVTCDEVKYNLTENNLISDWSDSLKQDALLNDDSPRISNDTIIEITHFDDMQHVLPQIEHLPPSEEIVSHELSGSELPYLSSSEFASLNKDQPPAINQIGNSEVPSVPNALVIDGSRSHTTSLLSGDSLDDLPSQGNKPYSTSIRVLTKALLESLLSEIEKREFSSPVTVALPVKSAKLIDDTEAAEPSLSSMTQESSSEEDKTRSDLDLSVNFTDFYELSASQDLFNLPVDDTLSKKPNLHVTDDNFKTYSDEIFINTQHSTEVSDPQIKNFESSNKINAVSPVKNKILLEIPSVNRFQALPSPVETTDQDNKTHNSDDLLQPNDSNNPSTNDLPSPSLSIPEAKVRNVLPDNETTRYSWLGDKVLSVSSTIDKPQFIDVLEDRPSQLSVDKNPPYTIYPEQPTYKSISETPEGISLPKLDETLNDNIPDIQQDDKPNRNENILSENSIDDLTLSNGDTLPHSKEKVVKTVPSISKLQITKALLERVLSDMNTEGNSLPILTARFDNKRYNISPSLDSAVKSSALLSNTKPEQEQNISEESEKLSEEMVYSQMLDDIHNSNEIILYASSELPSSNVEIPYSGEKLDKMNPSSSKILITKALLESVLSDINTRGLTLQTSKDPVNKSVLDKTLYFLEAPFADVDNEDPPSQMDDSYHDYEPDSETYYVLRFPEGYSNFDTGTLETPIEQISKENVEIVDDDKIEPFVLETQDNDLSHEIGESSSLTNNVKDELPRTKPYLASKILITKALLEKVLSDIREGAFSSNDFAVIPVS